MIGNVELGVVDPYRCRLAEQREPKTLAQLGDQVQPAAHLRPYFEEPQATVRVVQRGALEDADGAHVHGRLR